MKLFVIWLIATGLVIAAIAILAGRTEALYSSLIKSDKQRNALRMASRILGAVAFAAGIILWISALYNFKFWIWPLGFLITWVAGVALTAAVYMLKMKH
ncbi:MAG: hypothetical protein FWF98_03525 [Dehalococcoidia bacterium]|nr:hypothetical protein [Dehalococcoidia bacterium]